MLRDHLLHLSNYSIDRFMIRHDEILRVATWLCLRGIAACEMEAMALDGDMPYEVYRSLT